MCAVILTGGHTVGYSGGFREYQLIAWVFPALWLYARSSGLSAPDVVDTQSSAATHSSARLHSTPACSQGTADSHVGVAAAGEFVPPVTGVGPVSGFAQQGLFERDEPWSRQAARCGAPPIGRQACGQVSPRKPQVQVPDGDLFLPPFLASSHFLRADDRGVPAVDRRQGSVGSRLCCY